jgi:hypothetical protein
MKTQTKKLFRILKHQIHKGKIQNRFRESDCLTKKKGYRDAEYFLIHYLS